jgi:peptidoglycan hydrolase CwlO-like protein
MLYLIQLSEQKEFKEKVTKLQNTINNLSNSNSNNQKEYNILIEEVQKAYTEITTLLKQNNNTWSWLYKMA